MATETRRRITKEKNIATRQPWSSLAPFLPVNLLGFVPPLIHKNLCIQRVNGGPSSFSMLSRRPPRFRFTYLPKKHMNARPNSNASRLNMLRIITIKLSPNKRRRWTKRKWQRTRQGANKKRPRRQRSSRQTHNIWSPLGWDPLGL